MKKVIILFIFGFFSITTIKAQNWWEQGLVAYYGLDSLSLVDSSTSQVNLANSAQLQATDNRHNVANRAIDFPMATSFATGISSHLPQGNSSRSFSVWIKVNQLPNANLPFAFPFFYGAQQEKQGQGLVIDDLGFLYYSGYKSMQTSNADLESVSTINTNEWVHVGMSYDGDTAKIYINGFLDNSGLKNWNTATNTTFELGRLGATGGGMQGGGTIILPYDGAIDDIRIYDRELSWVEMVKLANDDFTALPSVSVAEELEVGVNIYPNPSSDVVNIQSTKKIEKLRLSTMEGKLLLETSNDQIDISGFQSGVYLLSYMVDGESGTSLIVKQ